MVVVSEGNVNVSKVLNKGQVMGAISSVQFSPSVLSIAWAYKGEEHTWERMEMFKDFCKWRAGAGKNSVTWK